MFESHGIEAMIADPRDFVLQDNRLITDGRTVDLVYNRLTDFYLESRACATLRSAFESGAAVFTPSPRAHALYANKRNLTVLSDEDTLRDFGVPEDVVRTLSSAVPRTVLVSADNAAELWAERRHLFEDLVVDSALRLRRTGTRPARRASPGHRWRRALVKGRRSMLRLPG
jgi:hypothetical protein